METCKSKMPSRAALSYLGEGEVHGGKAIRDLKEEEPSEKPTLKIEIDQGSEDVFVSEDSPYLLSLFREEEGKSSSKGIPCGLLGLGTL